MDDPITTGKEEEQAEESIELNEFSKSLGKIFQVSLGFIKDSQILEEIGEVNFQKDVPKEFICAYCCYVMWNPMIVEACGHIICKECFIRSPNGPENSIYQCPKDLNKIDENNLIYKEKLNKAIRESHVKCIEEDCAWIGQLDELDSHFSICIHKKLVCPQCNEIVKLEFLEQHKRNLCENRLLKCQDCNSEVFWKSLTIHEDVCQDKLIECPNKCLDHKTESTTLIKRSEMPTHLNNECLERNLPCPFNDFGCEKVLKVKRASQHFTKYSILHLNNLSDCGKSNRDKLEKQIMTMLAMKQKIVDDGKRLHDLKLRHGPQLLLKVVSVREKIDAASSGKNNEMASTQFFTSYPYGYQIFLKIAISGGKDKFLSVFISLCDGNFNSLLTWPFQQKIEIHLINQKNQNHLSHSIIPNPVKENFPFIQRPMNKRNPFFGIEKFIKMTNLDIEDSEFIVDDIMFLKIVVEPHNIV